MARLYIRVEYTINRVHDYSSIAQHDTQATAFIGPCLNRAIATEVMSSMQPVLSKHNAVATSVLGRTVAINQGLLDYERDPRANPDDRNVYPTLRDFIEIGLKESLETEDLTCSQ